MLSSYWSIPNTSKVKSVVCGGGAGGAGVCLCWAADRGGGEEGGGGFSVVK